MLRLVDDIPSDFGNHHWVIYRGEIRIWTRLRWVDAHLILLDQVLLSITKVLRVGKKKKLRYKLLKYVYPFQGL
jgi:hypothetical protein